MQEMFHQLSSWWFATMTPTHVPLTTIYQRETMRRRRLLSIIVLNSFLLVLFTLPLGALIHLTMLQFGMLYGLVFNLLITLLLNQRGFLTGAGIFYILSGAFLENSFIVSMSYSVPILSFCLWPVILISVVITGLFLPSWGPILLGLITIVFLYWFMLIECVHQFAIYIPEPHMRFVLYAFSCVIVVGVTVHSAIFTATTNKAVIGADRAAELEQAHRELATAYTDVEITNSKLEAALARIQKQALTDTLTDLPNHGAVIELLEKELHRARRSNHPFSVLFFDADHFKRINDTYGHAAGDIVLRQIGERARTVLRAGDTLGRFGGEEFVVLLLDAGANEAYTIAERIRAVVAAEPIVISQIAEDIPITVSIGLSTWTDQGTTGQDLLSQADAAMYVAKRLGRNQVRTADEARQMGENVELMALLQQEGQLEARQREGITPEQLLETYTLHMVCSLLSLLERRDEELSAHAHAVSDLATTIAQEMQLDSRQVSRIGMAALLHDIGKVAIPEKLLQEVGPLLSQGRAEQQDYAELSAQILAASPFLSDLVPAVLHHHEHWDGTGVPHQLAKEDIPLSARIIALAGAYDVLLRDHPYQASVTPDEAITELLREAGTRFDPTIVQALVTVLAKQQKLQKSLQMATVQ